MMFQRPVDGALYMHAKGLKVFPCKPNDKRPAFEGWQAWAKTADEKKIKDFGTANPRHNWGVYCEASGLAVLDIDKKKDRDGEATMLNLIQGNGKLSTTLTVITPSDGKHIYYRGNVKNTNDALGTGIDTRGQGGYVLAPGSRIDNRSYEIDNDATIVELDNWVVNQLKQAKKNKTILEEDTVIIEGNRNHGLTSLAGSMRGVGLDHDAILSALLITNEQSVSPPLPRDEVETIARSVCRYKPGSNAARVASDFINTDTKDITYSAAHIRTKNIPRRQWIMRHRYVARYLSVIIAKGGIGKSTLALLDAISICTGTELSGFDTDFPGAVWYYNAEDPKEELDRRVSALCAHHGIHLSALENLWLTSGRDRPLILAKQVRNEIVVNQEAVDHITAYIKQKKIRLFIADPFVKLHGVNENDNMAIDKVVIALNKIAEKTNCAICVIHHERKSGKGGAMAGDAERSRGASSLLSAARVAHTMDILTQEEAVKMGIPADRAPWFVRLDNAKSNMAVPASRASWFERESVELDNGDFVGSLRAIGLEEFSQEQIKKNFEAQAKNLAECLSQVMDINDVLSFKDAADVLLSDPKHAHLFRSVLGSTKKAYSNLQRLLKQEPYYADKKFRYVKDPGEKSRRSVMCLERRIGAAFT